jgi:amidase
VSDELIAMSAREAVRRLRARELSPLDLIDAAADRIAAVDGAVNALPTLCLDRARDAAKRFVAPDEPGLGWLAGLPLAVKDLNEVAGVRTTYGSPIFADFVPDRNEVSVDTLERNGAIPIAKSNTPEFGAGANTFNEVFGKTRNPWNTALTCGGSSGGSAVALATGMAWLATGSDLAGSLRTPASFCGVVGLRPSPGRVAHGPSRNPFQTLAVDGPMGRTVGDVGLMLDAECGQDGRDPLSFARPAASFQVAAEAPRAPRRVGFSANLGLGPVDAEVADICRAAVARFADAGAIVEEACPDFSGALDAFQVLRAELFVGMRATLLRQYRALLKPEVIWNIEKGMGHTVGDVGLAEETRGAIYHRVVDWFGDYDLLACPTAITPPFDVGIRYLERLGDHAFNNYVDWLYIVFAITLTSCPVISLPAGFTATGLPVGVQLVARPRGEAELLSFAAQLEAILDLGSNRPILPRAPA